jgi:hypothetical protein
MSTPATASVAPVAEMTADAAPASAVTDASDGAPPLGSAQLRAMVLREIHLIDSYPPKCGQLPGGHAGTILALGRQAAPVLVDEITDNAPTTWSYGNHKYVVGDFALDLLGDLYDCPDVVQVPPGTTMGWAQYIERPGERTRVQAKWRAFVRPDAGMR